MTERKSWRVTVPVDTDGDLTITDPVDVSTPVIFRVKGGVVSTDADGADLLARAYPDAVASPPPSADLDQLPEALDAATDTPPDTAGA